MYKEFRLLKFDFSLILKHYWDKDNSFLKDRSYRLGISFRIDKIVAPYAISNPQDWGKHLINSCNIGLHLIIINLLISFHKYK